MTNMAMPLTTRAKAPRMTTTADPESVARPADAPAEPARPGPVHLDLVDRDRSLRFWRDVVRLRFVADAGASLNHRARSTIEGTL
jgi:hypothetical protein